MDNGPLITEILQLRASLGCGGSAVGVWRVRRSAAEESRSQGFRKFYLMFVRPFVGLLREESIGHAGL